MKKILPVILLGLGLLSGGCAFMIPVYPMMFMMMKNDQPVPLPATPDSPNTPPPSAAPTVPGNNQDTATG